MKLALGADHRGFLKKTEIAQYLGTHGHVIQDMGTHSEESCDYPEIAAQVARAVASGKADRGILVCNSGIGMSIAANKISGIRAALCHSLEAARLSRQHNDANILVLAVKEMRDSLERVILVWLETPFNGGRHERRVNQIKEIEKTQGERS